MIYKLTILLSLPILFFSEVTKGISMQDIQLNLENSVFAVVKISYNRIGETPVEGGICGTAFLINDSIAITANHVLNSINYLPNPGYKYVQFWLVKRGTKKIFELKKDDLQPLPEIESTLIKIA